MNHACEKLQGYVEDGEELLTNPHLFFVFIYLIFPCALEYDKHSQNRTISVGRRKLSVQNKSEDPGSNLRLITITSRPEIYIDSGRPESIARPNKIRLTGY